MFWLVPDKKGYMLFFGAKPECTPEGTYMAANLPVGRLPEEAVDFKVTDPIHVKLIPSE